MNNKKFIYRVVVSNPELRKCPEHDCVLATDFNDALEQAGKEGFNDAGILNIILVNDDTKKEGLLS